MSVVLNFNYIVVRKTALENNYPGGLDAFRADWIPESIGQKNDEDQHLLSFISMGGYLQTLRKKLREIGLLEPEQRSSSAVFQGTDVHGSGDGCDWLEFDYEEGFLICWLKGKDRGPLSYAYMK